MKFFLLIGLIFTFGKFNRIVLKENESFSPRFVIVNWQKCPQFDTPPPPNALLNQPFYYLTKGKQSFVFESGDGQWVIKLLRLPKMVRHFSIKGKKTSLPFLAKTLEGCRLAQLELSEETQVVYAHLSGKKTFTQPLELIDKLGKRHYLDLNRVAFVVQRKGKSFYSNINENSIDQTILLFKNLYTKHITDHDAIIEKNYGVYNNKPFIIDVGQLAREDSPVSCEQYLRAMTHGLKYKIQEESPSLITYYEKALHRNSDVMKNTTKEVTR